MATRLEDLTILLTMVDRTRQATRSASNNISRVRRLTTALAAAGAVAGGAISTAMGVAIARGQEMTDQFAQLSRELDLTFRETQAFFNAVREADPRATIEGLNEAALTLAERMADARVEGGPLFALMSDFRGFELDLGVDNARDQLANFLEQVGQLPTASDRIFALKEVIGDEDARPFFNTINNTEKLNALLVDLRTNVEDVDGVLSGFQVSAIDRARESSGELKKEWDDFAINSFALYAPGLELINSILTKIVAAGNAVVGAIGDVQDRIRKLIGTYVQVESDIVVFDFETLETRTAELEKLQADAAKRREEAQKEANERLANLADDLVEEEESKNERILEEVRNHVREWEKLTAETIKLREGLLPNGEGEFLQSLDVQAGRAANDPFAFNESDVPTKSFAEIERENMEAFAESIGQVREALSASGSAFSAFARLAEVNGSKSFKTFQRLQIAVSTVAGISAQIQALASVDNPTFFQKLAAYARMGAIVASGLAALKSVNIGSSGSTAGSASGAATGAPANAQGGQTQEPQNTEPQRRVTVNIQGNGNYTPEQVEELIQAINDNDSSTQIDSRRIAA